MKTRLIAALLLATAATASLAGDTDYWDRGSNVQRAIADMKAAHQRAGIPGAIEAVTRCYVSVMNEGLTPLSERCMAMDMAAHLQAFMDKRSTGKEMPAFLGSDQLSLRQTSQLSGYEFGSVRQYGEDIAKLVVKEMNPPIGKQ